MFCFLFGGKLLTLCCKLFQVLLDLSLLVISKRLTNAFNFLGQMVLSRVMLVCEEFSQILAQDKSILHDFFLRLVLLHLAHVEFLHERFRELALSLVGCLLSNTHDFRLDSAQQVDQDVA
jgi:hypothetical protein